MRLINRRPGRGNALFLLVMPFLLLLNKVDLDQQWRVDPEELDRLRASNWLMSTTSAKTGQGVENAFTTLAQKMMGN